MSKEEIKEQIKELVEEMEMMEWQSLEWDVADMELMWLSASLSKMEKK